MSTKAGSAPGRKKTSSLFREAKTFSSFSVNDLRKANDFYGQILGLDCSETPEGLELHTANRSEEHTSELQSPQ